MDMVERIVGQLYENGTFEDYVHDTMDPKNEPILNPDRRLVKAVIEAMREPTEEMVAFVHSDMPGADLVAKGYWQAMIDAALGEK